MKSMRPTLYGSRHAVSAGHYLAAAAGFAILEAGGNAIDAGCAAGIALAVLHPDEVNVAGVAPIMIRTGPQGGRGKVVTIAGLGHWPSRFPADLFMREHGGKMPLGLLRTVVPAAPDAWITALCDYGTMSFGEVARRRHPPCPRRLRRVRVHGDHDQAVRGRLPVVAVQCRDLPARRPGAAKSATASCRPTWPAPCNTWSTRNAPPRSTAGWRDCRRRAPPSIAATSPRRSCATTSRSGGYLRRDDLAGFHSRYEAPVSVRWRDFEVFTCGPWCQGPMLAQALRMIEAAGGLKGLAHNSADYIHLVTEILKAACADREYRYGDPLFVDVGLDELLSDGHVAARVGAIDTARAMPDMPPPLGRHPGDRAAARVGIAHRGAMPRSSPTPPTVAPSTAGATRCRRRRRTARGARR